MRWSLIVAAALVTGCLAVPSGEPATRSRVAPGDGRFEVRDVTYRMFVNGRMEDASRQASGTFAFGDDMKRAFETVRGPLDPAGDPPGSALIKVTERIEASDAYFTLSMLTAFLVPWRATATYTVRAEFTSASGEDLGYYQERRGFTTWYWLPFAPAILVGADQSRILVYWDEAAARAAAAAAGR